MKSAVSSVSTPGVLVTIKPFTRAASRSMLSTPLPKLAMRRSPGPASAIREASIRSVTVGTSTSAVLTAATRSARLIGLSSTLSRASNNSRMRVSTTSGSRRVTITIGFLGEFGMGTRLFFSGVAFPRSRQPQHRNAHLDRWHQRRNCRCYRPHLAEGPPPDKAWPLQAMHRSCPSTQRQQKFAAETRILPLTRHSFSANSPHALKDHADSIKLGSCCGCRWCCGLRWWQ